MRKAIGAQAPLRADAVGVAVILVSVILGVLLAGAALAAPRTPPVPASRGEVLYIEVTGVIAPSTSRYINRAIREATELRAEALLIQLDTPGGLMKSMDDITKGMLNAQVPILVFIAPSGARAASAGVFVTYAANLAAMAPGTHIGAAHPVAVGEQGEQNKTMIAKITNDAVANIKAIATRRGRNAEWAEQAVRESVSVSDQEAVRLHVVDLIALDVTDLLEKVDGRTVETAAGPTRLATRGAVVRTGEMDATERFLDLLSDPNIGLILMTIAIYGIIIEMGNPGAILPGVLGGIALILALTSFAILEVNVAGLAMIGLSLIFFIADIKVPGHGVLTIGGVLAFVMGAVLLTERSLPFLRVSIQLAVLIGVLTGAFFLFAVTAGLRAQKVPPRMGEERLAGATGVARTNLAPEGEVYVLGEAWSAYADNGHIAPGERVQVVAVEGLRLKVRPLR
ncbi:MAG TPA: nodulation protein NfeD [bacterium]|nr:nodulation protein NfeD [bacterium]